MLIEEIISDGITIDPAYHTKFYNTIMKWINTIHNTAFDEYRIVDKWWDKYRHEYTQNTQRLAKMLYPNVYNLIRPHYRQVDRSFPYAGRDIPAEQISGYRVGIDTSILGDSAGSVGESWTLRRVRKGQYVMFNRLILGITQQEYGRLIFGGEPEKKRFAQEMVKTLSHEITHLIQGLKSSELRARGKQYADIGGKYKYGTAEEIEAYAQTFATHVIQTVPTEIILRIVLQSGKTEFFGANIMKADSSLTKYQELKNHTVVWRRFLKKVYEKLKDYVGSKDQN